MCEIKKISSYGIQNTISHCVGNKIQEKNTCSRGEELFRNKAERSKEVLSGLGIYTDGD